jgi:hypothetical protein
MGRNRLFFAFSSKSKSSDEKIPHTESQSGVKGRTLVKSDSREIGKVVLSPITSNDKMSIEQPDLLENSKNDLNDLEEAQRVRIFLSADIKTDGVELQMSPITKEYIVFNSTPLETGFDEMSALSGESEPIFKPKYHTQIAECCFETPSGKSGRFTGSLDNNIPHGQGECIFNDGDRYQGPFYKGKMHGPSATLIKHDGTIYIGDFFDNLPHGYGIYKISNRIYAGGFKRGEFHGEGKLLNLDGSVNYEGKWISGEPLVDMDLKVMQKISGTSELNNMIDTISRKIQKLKESAKNNEEAKIIVKGDVFKNTFIEL